MKEQEIIYINIKELGLWTENPRDSINENASDQDIIELALSDRLLRWELPKLAKEMGEYYDFSELPTVVYHRDIPIVYDGNKRIILGKLKHQLVNVNIDKKIKIPEFPIKIPCNVCNKEVGLQNVYRKHAESGSWPPLERDIFLHKHMGKAKSNFLALDEKTSFITSNPHLNKVFVKEEILSPENLKNLGFDIKEENVKSKYDNKNASSILTDLSNKIQTKVITTRKRRGQVIEILEPSTRELIDQNRSSKFRPINFLFESNKENIDDNLQRRSRRTKKSIQKLFGRKLYLKHGNTNDIYRDIAEMYHFYQNNPKNFSPSFLNLIRMALRLLCETAANDTKQTKLEGFLRNNFAKAKQSLDQNDKTTLSNNNVDEKSICQLLHTGAHNYSSASNNDQTIALSIIIGAILTNTHGKVVNA